MHILIESIDGAGKGTVVPLIIEEIRSRNREILTVAEPTYEGIGKFIREEIIFQHADGHRYSGQVTAQMFAIDREVLYTETILPWKQTHPDGVIVQDRGALSSLAYQPLQDPAVGLEWLLSLRGNQIELSNPPDALFILRIDPAEAERRLAARTDKQDNSVFEKRDFQEKLAARYLDPEIQAPYRTAGTKIFVIDAGGTREEVAERVKEALRTIL
ncbi:dTMP kinase [Candidatus Uhrbacteria bacterium]|nr:dTMP kinase [Candidatus Uhrbacteria bacterium]